MSATMEAIKKISPFANEIAKHLLSLEAVQFNVNEPFIWVSGIKSPVYCDNRKIVSDVKIRNEMVDAFVEVIKTNFTTVEIIAGVATGGIPLGVLVADRMNLPFIYVRQAPKEHGLKRQVEGDYKDGDKVVLIEDHISTGLSSLKAIDGLRKEKLNLLGLISVMTYGFKKANQIFNTNKVDHFSLCDLDTILDVSLNLKNITLSERDAILAFRNSQ